MAKRATKKAIDDAPEISFLSDPNRFIFLINLKSQTETTFLFVVSSLHRKFIELLIIYRENRKDEKRVCSSVSCEAFF